MRALAVRLSFERLAHGVGQAGVGHAHFAVELGLAAQQLLVELLVAAFHAVHQGLQAADHLGQGGGLHLQRPISLLALVRQ